MYIWSTEDNVIDHVAEKLIGRSYKTCILPRNYINDYYLFKTGTPDLVDPDFFDIYGNGYVLLLISRKLTESETYIISFICTLLKRATNCFRLYIISDEGMSNGELYYEMVNADGIHPRIIYNGNYNECIFDECAEKIVNDICDLDMYHHNLS